MGIPRYSATFIDSSLDFCMKEYLLVSGVVFWEQILWANKDDSTHASKLCYITA